MSGPYGRQLALVDDPIDVAFAEFHHAHPEVYTDLVRLARRWRDAGQDRIGIGMLFEVLRWDRGLAGVRDAEGFKLNNNYRSRYARLIMANEPDLVGIFSTRSLTAGGDE